MRIDSNPTRLWRRLSKAGAAATLIGAAVVPAAIGPVRVAGAAHTAAISHDKLTLIIGSQYGDPQNFDPIATFTLAWGMICSNVFDALVYRGDDLKIHMDLGLASDWKYLNQNTLRFSLRKGVTFQDGEPFNAAAVKYTFDRLLGPLGQKGAQYFQYKTIKEVKIVNPYTVDFITKAPDPVLVTKLAGYGAMIVPPAYIKQHGDTYFATHPIGTGAYQVTSYVPNLKVDLVRYNKYWRGPAKMAKVEYRFIQEDATRIAELQTGHIDIMQKVAIGQTSVIKSSSSLHLYPVGSATVEGIFLNGRISPTNNLAVRQAINYAIDTKSIIKDVLNGYGKQVSTWQSSFSFGNDPSLAPYPYNPDKAKSLIASAHLKGSPTVTFSIDGTDTVFKQIAEVIVAELQQVGITVNLQTLNPTVMYNTKIPTGKYGNMAEFVWGGWTLDFDSTAYSLYHTGEFYNPGYSNPVVNNLLEAGRTTLDQSSRLATYKKLDSVLYHDVPNVVLFQSVNLWAASSSVHNFVAPPDDRLELHDVSLS
ncbi:MAG: extracellular solute-binding protein family 5 [Chloroflexi bacterium]|nr:extracellular solute-binding protein family 5 [Chloroflexota bacterium]